MRKTLLCGTALLAIFGFATMASAEGTIPVGHLACYTGPTSDASSAAYCRIVNSRSCT